MTDEHKPPTERVTVRVPVQMLDQVDRRVERGQFCDRSELVRAGIRRVLMDLHSSQAAREHVGGDD